MFQIDLEQCLKTMINILIYLPYKISNQDKANINTWKKTFTKKWINSSRGYYC